MGRFMLDRQVWLVPVIGEGVGNSTNLVISNGNSSQITENCDKNKVQLDFVILQII